jgi:hypothetical protein
MRPYDARTSHSLLRPGVEIPIGSAYCLACSWAVLDLDDPGGAAVHHHGRTGHPTIARPPADQHHDDA